MQTFNGTSQDQRPAAADRREPQSVRNDKVQPIIPTSCAPRQAHRQSLAKSHRAIRGFTLIELMLAVSIAGILSGVAYPSFMGQVQKVRRADALISMLQVQSAQERWRSNNLSYGALNEIGVAAVSTAGHYTLQVAAHSEIGYEIVATAIGAQANDLTCRTLRLRVTGANLVQASGPVASTDNPATLNRQCWNL
jgi:type IV pilus assembly protein PilE